MATRSRLYWTISCDVCGRIRGNDDYDYTVYDTESDAIGAAQDSDWVTFPDLHVCCYCVDEGKTPASAHRSDGAADPSCQMCDDEWPCEMSPTQTSEPSFIAFNPEDD